jgi:hypothetical protein
METQLAEGVKAARGGKDMEESSKSITEGIAEDTSVMIGTGEDVVTEGVERFATLAGLSSTDCTSIQPPFTMMMVLSVAFRARI